MRVIILIIIYAAFICTACAAVAQDMRARQWNVLIQHPDGTGHWCEGVAEVYIDVETGELVYWDYDGFGETVPLEAGSVITVQSRAK